MSKPDATPSLIQQRLALGRLRLTALFTMLLWGTVVALLAFGGFDVAEVIDWLAFIVPLAATLYGMYLWFDYLRKRRAFKAEHGPDAGMQP